MKLNIIETTNWQPYVRTRDGRRVELHKVAGCLMGRVEDEPCRRANSWFRDGKHCGEESCMFDLVPYAEPSKDETTMLVADEEKINQSRAFRVTNPSETPKVEPSKEESITNKGFGWKGRIITIRHVDGSGIWTREAFDGEPEKVFSDRSAATEDAYRVSKCYHCEPQIRIIEEVEKTVTVITQGLYNIPQEVANAAKLLENFFIMAGHKEWEFMGVRSRFKSGVKEARP